MEWSNEELATLDLGDKRRNLRAREILEEYVKCPESTPHAFCDNAATEATMRFADSPYTSPEVILEAHRDATLDRVRRCSTVVTIQDTTTIDLTKPKQQVVGAGPLETNSKRGYYFHPLYAVSEEGIPLGLLDHRQWTREELEKHKPRKERAKERRNAELIEKESAVWLEMFQSSEQVARSCPDTQFVHLADSEADIHELFLERYDQASNHHFIVRACQDRTVVCSDSQDYVSCDEVLSKLPTLFEFAVEVSERTALISTETRTRRKSRTARTATLSVRATNMVIRGPERPGGRLSNVELNIVEAVEVAPPENEDAIRWVLATTLPIVSEADIRRILTLYMLRWLIELFFKTLKSGMRIEKLKYETLDRYQTIAAILYIAAFRVEQLKLAARVEPDAPCTDYFSASEWIPLYLIVSKTKSVPETPPTMQQFLILVARAGGYLPKKNSPPGSKTIWRGLQKMEAYRDAYLAFYPA